MVMSSETRQPKTRPRLAADQLERIGVLLLRHQAGAAGHAIAQLQPAEFLAGIEDPVFRQAAEVDHRDRGGVEEVQREIAVGGNVHAVAGDGGETQVARHGFAVERETAAGQRAGAERQHVGAGAGLAEALPIAREHFEIGQQVVRPQHGLRAAQMGIAGNHGIRRGFGLAGAARPSRPPPAPRTWSHSSRSQSRVSSDTCSLRLRPVWILSATAPAFSFSLRITSVWTSSSVAPSKNAGAADSARMASNAADDPRALVGRQDAHAFQSAREGLRAADIGIEQTPVEIERAREALEHLRRSGSKRPPQSFMRLRQNFIAEAEREVMISRLVSASPR